MKLIEKTLKSSLCMIANCPAIFETDRDTYVVIGKQLSSKDASDLLKGRIGTGETAVEFPKELLKNIFHDTH